MSSNIVSLDRLRDDINHAQRSGNPDGPKNPRIFVKNGKIITAEEAASDDSRQISEVSKETFYSSRYDMEAAVAMNKMPPGTRPLVSGGASGWLYSFTCEFGEHYEMFAYHDGSSYQVKLIYPEHEGKYNAHRGHLFEDGNLCLSMGLGMPTLESAYAKSILWATGFSALSLTGEFPF